MHDQLAEATQKYRGYSEALYAALAVDPFYVEMEKSVEHPLDPKEAMLRYYDYSIHEAEQFGHLWRPEEPPFGVSVWSVPLTPDEASKKSEAKKSFILTCMGKRSLQTYEEIVGFMSKASESVVAESDWYLSILGILPEFQGKGLGGDLVRPILQQADEAGIASYLETFTPRNMSFYERLGYQAIASFSEPVTKSDYWIMRREPANHD
jgi:ribosomal protein S18 acetylase RimI-like enzyme